MARSESFRVKRAGEALDGVHHSRRGAIDGVAHDYDVPLLHRCEILPSGTCAQRMDLALRVSRVRAGEHQNFRLKPDNLFHADARPLGFRIHDGAAARETQRVRDKRAASIGNQGVSPDDEKHAARRGPGKPAVNFGEPAAQIHAVSVEGERSGAHAGRVEAYSQGDGASFVPTRPFAQGELVSVHAELVEAGHTTPFAWSFTVAVRDQPGSSSAAVVGVGKNPAVTRSTPQHYQSFHSRPELRPPESQTTTPRQRERRRSAGLLRSIG